MAMASLTIHLSDHLYRAVQTFATQESDTNTVIVRALEEYVRATEQPGQRPGKYQKPIKALNTPVTDLHLSACPATALQTSNMRYVYELVQKSPRDLFKSPNFGEKTLREVKETLTALGLTLGMMLDSAVYADAVMAAMIAGMQTTKRGPARGEQHA